MLTARSQIQLLFLPIEYFEMGFVARVFFVVVSFCRMGFCRMEIGYFLYRMVLIGCNIYFSLIASLQNM